MTLSTGCTPLNELLDGYEIDVITTIYGPAGSGKTTACLLAAVEVLKAGKKVIYIDTEGGFSIARFNQVCDDKSLLENIFILSPTTFTEQIESMKKLKELVDDKIGLIVVDTISMLYRIQMGLPENDVKAANSELGLQLSYLNEVSRKKKIPILITNQVYADFEEKDAVKMVGGDILKYASKCLVEIQKFRTKRKAVLRKHRSIAENKEVTFAITGTGFESNNL